MRDALVKLEPMNILSAPSQPVRLSMLLEAAGRPAATLVAWQLLCELVGERFRLAAREVALWP